MASYSVAAGEIGVYGKTLTANTVDTITFPGDVTGSIEVSTNGSAALYFTVDGSTPTVGGAATHELLAGAVAARIVQSVEVGTTVVKVISAGTPTYSVAVASMTDVPWFASQTGTSGSAGSSGSALTPTAVKTANYTAASGDLVRVDTTSGAVTVTLPAAAAGATVGVKLVTLGGSNAVTIAAAGSDVFNKAGGATTLTLSLLNQGVVLAAVSGVWVVQADDLALSQLDARFGASSSQPYTIDITKAPYNASKVGKQYVNVVATAGSPIINCPEASFDSGDVGKQVMVTGAGTAGAPFVSTVLSVQSATRLTMAANAVTTNAAGHGVAIGTDCTAAVQAAIDALAAGNGGTIFFPAGVYLLLGSQVTGTVGSWTYTGQLLFPPRPLTSSHMGIRLLGETPPGGAQWGWSIQQAPSSTGAILLSAATAGNVFDVKSDATGNPFAAGYTAILAQFENLSVRLPLFSAANAINGRYLAGLRVLGTNIDHLADASATPGTGSGVGIWMPGYANSAQLDVAFCSVYGFATGIIVGEHTGLYSVFIGNCTVGITPDGNGLAHSVTITNVNVSGCGTMLKASTSAMGVTGQITSEQNTIHIADTFSGSGGGLMGDLIVHKALGSGGLTVRGAGAPYKLNIRRTDAPVGWMGQPVKDTFARVSESATNPDITDLSHHYYQMFDAMSLGIASGKGKPVSGAYGVAVCPIPQTWRSYAVSGKIKLGTASSCIGWGIRAIGSNGQYLGALLQINGGTNNVVIMKRTGYTQLATSAALGMTSGSTVDFAVTWEQKVPGAAVTVRAFLNGTEVVSYALSGAEITQFTPTEAIPDLYAGIHYGSLGFTSDGTERVVSMAIDRI